MLANLGNASTLSAQTLAAQNDGNVTAGKAIAYQGTISGLKANSSYYVKIQYFDGSDTNRGEVKQLGECRRCGHATR